MKENFILIDFLYINSGGGKKILETILYRLSENYLNNYFFLFDSRLKLSKSFDDVKNYLKIEPSERSRKSFYKKNKNIFSSVFCMSNVPPPIKLKVNVFVYFHNDLLLKPLASNLKLKFRMFNLIKKYYILINNKAEYSWIVQTKLMKSKVEKSLNIKSNKISVLPIFSLEGNYSVSKEKNKFLYVSNFSKHKNHFNLFKAFIDASYHFKDRVELHLTIDKSIYGASFYANTKLPENLKIVNHGELNYNDLSKLYASSEYFIFPSLNESFGLPLVESVNMGCKVIASELEYVKQVINPSLTFNPNLVKSISVSIIRAVREEQKASKIIIENKIDTFIEYLSKNVKK
tara:strand:+ start:29071 stop:30108 length:1038 start_codon:yes stop_codon:yes gene_type:complete